MIEIEPGAVTDVFSYAGLKRYIAEMFTDRVDVVNRAALKPSLRPLAMADALYAF